MLADYHIHTGFSDDSEMPMEEGVEKAIALGFDEICFTEHIDYGVKGVQNCSYPAYRKRITECRQLYGDRIRIKCGMEFGIQIGTVPEFQKSFDQYELDFVLLSCHQVDNLEFWDYSFQQGKRREEIHQRYYQEILKVMEVYQDYSVLAHLDMIQRYDKEGYYPLAPVKDLVIKILQRAIRDGKGIEVNTSCFHYGLPDLTPSREIIRLYRELGGEIITVGSDAHSSAGIGYGIPAVREELKQMGFSSIYTFDRMEAKAHEL